MKTTYRSYALGAALFLAARLALQASPVLVGNKGLAGQKLGADEVKAVLLGKKTTLGKDRVIIVTVKAGESQEAFLKEVVGMSTEQFKTYWRRLFMTGGGSAPKIAENEAEACKLVAETAGAVAVVDSAKADELTVLFTK